ncbi:hypothetical protein Taro_032112 [Colocasia esculenta]|uniref:Uncharacterized protein n=1 Tax=Colocasia esculenta TaxID=4460 RepID=A0A843VTX1_COLES|nr:hypothetical protein [Colocasia esculenta]
MADTWRGRRKATHPLSRSHVQRFKCPSREHKPQFVSLLGGGFSSGELRLGDFVGGLGGRPWCSLARGGARLVGGGSWIAGARRWRVASLREGPLRLDLHLEGEEAPGSWEEVRGSPELGDRSVSPSGSPDLWAAVPTVGSLVGAGDPGGGAVTLEEGEMDGPSKEGTEEEEAPTDDEVGGSSEMKGGGGMDVEEAGGEMD